MLRKTRQGDLRRLLPLTAMVMVDMDDIIRVDFDFGDFGFWLKEVKRREAGRDEMREMRVKQDSDERVS